MPKPFLQAVRSLSEGNGLNEEAVAWCFYANIAFLEHHSRRVGHKAGQHTQAPNLPVFIGGPPSSRKTCLIEMTNSFLLQAPEAPKMMQNRECRSVLLRMPQWLGLGQPSTITTALPLWPMKPATCMTRHPLPFKGKDEQLCVV